MKAVLLPIPREELACPRVFSSFLLSPPNLDPKVGDGTKTGKSFPGTNSSELNSLLLEATVETKTVTFSVFCSCCLVVRALKQTQTSEGSSSSFINIKYNSVNVLYAPSDFQRATCFAIPKWYFHNLA